MAAQIPFGWSVRSRRPIDDRYIVADLTARDALDTFRRHEGLFCYVESNDKTYKLIGGIDNANWVEVLENINILAEETTVDSSNDTITFWDNDAATHKKIKISNLPSSGGGVTSVNGETGVVVLDAADVGAEPAFSKGSLLIGTGISLTGATASRLVGSGDITIANTDRGSSQNIFKNFAVSGQSTVVADSNNDTLTLVAGSNVTITTNASTDSITISATDTNTTYTAGTGLTLVGTQFQNTDRGSSQSIFKNFAVSGQSTVVADSNNDTLTLVAGSNVTITTDATTDTITIASTATGGVTSVNGETGVVVLDAADVGAEPAFTKNTAFNKNFGTTAGTVAEGNDSRILNGQTAFSWGDHATEGYLKVVNLGYTASPTNGVVTNSAGTNSTIPLVTTTNAGLMIPADKTKLDGVATNANNYVHPTGFSNQPSVALTGTNVISRVLVNNEGHVTGADTRALSLDDFTLSGSNTEILINKSGNIRTASGFKYFDASASLHILSLNPSASGSVAIIENNGSATSELQLSSPNVIIGDLDSVVGFYAQAGATRQSITGVRAGNEALASLLSGLAATGLITDNTTAGTAPEGSKWTEVTNGIYRNGRVAVNKSSVGTTYALDVSGNSLFDGSIRTAAPSGSTAVDWKFGNIDIGSVIPNRRVGVEINGTFYYIAVEDPLI